MARTVLITSCSSGFGEASARVFADRGWNVVATMRYPEASTTLSANERLTVERLDVQDIGSISLAIAAGIARFGRIDTLISNAGFGLSGVFEGTPREKIEEQFEVNLFGLMDVIREMLPHFRQNRAGTIINVSSGAGVFALPLISLYSASKFALEGFSESLSYELASLGITVKIVEPGGVTTTKFSERSGTEAEKADTLPDYIPFLQGAAKVFDRLQQNATATAEQVAEVIFNAATDETDQLRYVATDDIKPLVTMRRESSERDYMAYMREWMTPDRR